MINLSCPACGKTLPLDAPQGICPACLLQHTFQDSPATAQPPEIEMQQLSAAFPHLVIEEMIGQGGMGRVYRAQQPHLNRTVALKVLSAERVGDAEWLERFNREARALARLSHPHIVQVYDFGEKPLPFLLMEHVEGVNLRQAMQQGGLTAREALAIVPKLCDALHYAHDHGVLHRDIKPENILIDTEGRVKLVDFGLAKLRDESVPFTLTQSGAKLGTLAYMAPEQVEKPADVDHRADIYSLGVVLYEMLTGELPLGRFPSPSEASGVDARLDNVVMRTLEKHRDKRFQTADALKTGLEEAERARPVASAPACDRMHVAQLLLCAFAGILLSLTQLSGLAALAGVVVSVGLGIVGAFQLRRCLSGERIVSLPWPSLSLYALLAIAFFSYGRDGAGALFGLMALLTARDMWRRLVAGTRFMHFAGYLLGGCIYLVLVLSVTAIVHEWLAAQSSVARTWVSTADAAGLLLAFWLALPRFRSAVNLVRGRGAIGLILGPWERVAAAMLAVLLTPSFPSWKPQVRLGGKPSETLKETRMRQYEGEKPMRDQTEAWVSRATKADTKEGQNSVLQEVRAALQSSDAVTLRAALNAVTGLHQLDFDHTPFREEARRHLESSVPDVRISALNALYHCKPDETDRPRLIKLATNCTEGEIAPLLFAFKMLNQNDFTGEDSKVVLSLLERGMAASQRDGGSMLGLDSRIVLGVIWGSKVSPEIEARLIVWSHLQEDENGEIRASNSSLGYNTFYHALSVQQNKSRAVVKRLMELAYHADTTNIAGRCLWGLNGTVSDPADQAYMAGEVIKLLGLRNNDYLWRKGLLLIDHHAGKEHLPALEELSKRETLPTANREALNSIIQRLNRPT